MPERIFVFGASGHAKVVIDAAQRSGHEVAGVFDDNPALRGGSLLGRQIVGGRDTLQSWCAAHRVTSGVIAIGDNRIRQDVAVWLLEAGLTLTVIVHPHAVLAEAVVLGRGTIVMAGAILNPNTTLGANCIVNTGASIDHDCVIGNAVHIAPGCRVCGGVRIGEGALLGVGTVVIPGIEIGAGAMIGAGSTVVSDVGRGVKAFGTPCRVR